MIKLGKLGCVSVIGVLGLIGAVRGCLGGGGGGASSAEERSGGSATESAGGSSAATGDRITLGDYAYTVHGYRTASTIGDPDVWGVAADEGATFVIVDYTIENLTNETQTVMSDDLMLRDARGRKFSSSSDATTALLTDDGQDFLLSELQPGLPKRIKTAFTVPRAAIEGELRIVIPEKGFFSSGEAIVRLK